MVKNAEIEHTLGMKKALRVEASLERALIREKERVEELQVQLNTTIADKVVLERERKRGEDPNPNPNPYPIPNPIPNSNPNPNPHPNPNPNPNPDFIPYPYPN
jgi:hypothetical protein